MYHPTISLPACWQKSSAKISDDLKKKKNDNLFTKVYFYQCIIHAQCAESAD